MKNSYNQRAKEITIPKIHQFHQKFFYPYFNMSFESEICYTQNIHISVMSDKL